MKNDKAVIKSFIDHLNQTIGRNIKIEKFPDEENREKPDIDAIAGKYAIEHTSVDTIKTQRRNSDWFMQVVNGLEEELSSKLSYRLNITLPWDNVQPGQNWPKIRSSFRNWIINESPNCDNGYSCIDNITNIPFKLHVHKSARNPGLFFARYDPKDSSLSNRLFNQLQPKIGKLKPYKEIGKETILLIESNDIALMNQWTMIEAIFTAFSKGFPAGLDQIWYADTSLPNYLIFENITDIVKENIENS